MNRIGFLLLLLAGLLWAQPQDHTRTQPPLSSPAIFPQDHDFGQMPPDTEAPPFEALSSAEIRDRIQIRLDSDAVLSNTCVTASVDDTSVVLVGAVENERERDLVIRIAQSYAGQRRIVDNIAISDRH
jgi:hypothetical protein